MKKSMKLLSAALSALLLGACTLPVFAAEPETSKDENVFAILNTDGSVKKETVSDTLRSKSGFHNYKDKSCLTDIENLKGSETPQQEGDTLTWNSDETALYYSGSTEKQLPVTADITYQLDGQFYTAEEMTGKSGHLTVRVKLTNYETETARIDGKDYKVCTPFVTVLSAVLPADRFQNVTAQSGTLQTDSTNQLVAFVCLPGLKDCCGSLLTDQLAGIKDYLLDEVSFEADVTNFSAPDLLIVYATDASQVAGVSSLADFDKLNADLTQLQSAMDQLLSGAKQLNDGSAALKAGADELLSGSQTVDSLLQQVCANNTSLNQGASDLFDAVLSAASAQLSSQLGSPVSLTQANYTATINGILASLGQENIYAAVKQGVEAQVKTAENCTAARQQASAAVGAAILMQQNPALSEEEAAAQAAQLLSAEGDNALKTALAAQQDTINTLAQAALDKAVLQTMESADVQALLTQKLTAASAGAKEIAALQAQLDKAASFVAGVSQYTASVASIQQQGSAKVYAGAIQLQKGAGELAAGANTLYGGIGELYSATTALTGSSLVTNVEELQKVGGIMEQRAADFKSFTGAPDGADASVKFVLKTQADKSLTKADEDTASSQPGQKTTFFQRVAALFTKNS